MWQSLNLHLCVNLHSVVVYAGPTFEDEEPTLAEQRIALQCLPSSIRSCTVGFHEKDIRNLDFGELRPLLTRFGRLERLVFQYHLGFKVDGGEPVEVEQARERIAASFPDLERRGVFHLREAQRGHYSQRTSIQGEQNILIHRVADLWNRQSRSFREEELTSCEIGARSDSSSHRLHGIPKRLFYRCLSLLVQSIVKDSARLIESVESCVYASFVS